MKRKAMRAESAKEASEVHPKRRRRKKRIETQSQLITYFQRR
jgi:hypothetical protein